MRKLMKGKLVWGWLVIFFTLAAVSLAQEDPPSLQNFHQLYGAVSGLPEGTFTLKATVGGHEYATPLDADAQYGYSPTFKVYGQDGQTISFALVSSLGLSTALGTTATFQAGAFSQVGLVYPTPGGEPAAAVHGCMNRTAINYNSNVTIDDGSCQFAAAELPAGEGKGCRHQNATNYNASATEDDESCVFPAGIIAGCLNASAANYNASATLSYGRCLFRYGCTNTTALNYNASAGLDDGSCRFAGNRTACLMKWECGSWSSCATEQQTRSCLRVDNCDSLVAQGNATLTNVPKPEEGRACPMPTETTKVCTPNAKRCSGTDLEQCSFDGRQWSRLQSCPLGCNAVTLQCREETLPPAAPAVKEEKKPFPVWLFYLIAILILAGVAGAGVFFFLGWKKYVPAREYIKESRREGFPDPQIRSRLVSQGWEPEKVNQLLK